eukprot:467092_1
MSEECKEKAQIRITFYPFWGRGHALRLAAILGDIPFEDDIIIKQKHIDKKKAGQMRWRGVPELTILKNGLVIGQSNTCLRYIGKISKNNLYPDHNDVLLQTLCDEILDSAEDFLIFLLKTMRLKTDKEKIIERSKDEFIFELNLWLNAFENRLIENENRGNKNGYFIADNITIADCKIYFYIYKFGTDYWTGINTNILDKYVKLKRFISVMCSNEKIKQFNKDMQQKILKYDHKRWTTYH